MKTKYFLASLKECVDISKFNFREIESLMNRINKTARTLQDKLQERYDDAEEPEYDSQIEIFEERQERLEERIDELEEIINISEDIAADIDGNGDFEKLSNRIVDLYDMCDEYQTIYRGLKTLKLEEE